MLVNLCENYLNTEVRCDQPSTDGYEVNNLLINNSSGFLAYSTIKPPINIDFNFICKIRLSHILIWPCVGSQKSTGFKISTTIHHHRPHNLLSNGFLDANHTGILFSTKYMKYKSSIPGSENFLKTSIYSRHNNTIDSIDNLRITIVKTDKSVPAINKIEIWGFISLSSHGFDGVNAILDLLSKREVPSLSTIQSNGNSDGGKVITKQSTKSLNSLSIPEEFLDPITWTLMLQPIILPSGKIIDQSTLESFGENEALWGRPLSDPFTGIKLDNNYRPIFALQLKVRIDKFLSENSDDQEVKKLPRIIGHGNTLNKLSCYPLDRQKIQDAASKQNNLVQSSSDVSTNKINYSNKNTIHKLPVGSRQCLRRIVKSNLKKMTKNALTITKSTVLKMDNETLNVNCKIDDELKDNLQHVLSSLKRFNVIKVEDKNAIMGKNGCNCCEFPIFYKLPCDHIVCRKFISSQNGNSNSNNNKNNIDKINSHCPRCNSIYKTSEIIKFHS